MPLSSTTVKAEAEKLELAKLRGINISKLFRDALDTSLKVYGDDREMLESKLTDIRKQMEILDLEEKFVLAQLKSLDSLDAVEQYRNEKYEQWKKSLTYQVRHKTIDWENVKKLFRFSTVGECERWITERLDKEGFI